MIYINDVWRYANKKNNLVAEATTNKNKWMPFVLLFSLFLIKDQSVISMVYYYCVVRCSQRTEVPPLMSKCGKMTCSLSRNSECGVFWNEFYYFRFFHRAYKMMDMRLQTRGAVHMFSLRFNCQIQNHIMWKRKVSTSICLRAASNRRTFNCDWSNENISIIWNSVCFILLCYKFQLKHIPILHGYIYFASKSFFEWNVMRDVLFTTTNAEQSTNSGQTQTERNFIVCINLHISTVDFGEEKNK